jgi:hypothetical protein
MDGDSFGSIHVKWPVHSITDFVNKKGVDSKPAPSPYHKFINPMNRQENQWIYWILHDDLLDGVTQNHVLFVVLGHPLS